MAAENQKNQNREADGYELAAMLEGVLARLCVEKKLEVSSRDVIEGLAADLLNVLASDREIGRDHDLADFIVDCDGVTELFLDDATLRLRFRDVLLRIENGDPPPKHHPELAAAIVAAPDDLQARGVYGDWLQENGDPRGELIAIQLQRADRKKDKKLASRETLLLTQHRRHFYGELRSYESGSGISFGFFDDIKVFGTDAFEALLDLETARFLQELTVHCHSLSPIDALLAKGGPNRRLPETLRDLSLETERGQPIMGGLDIGRAINGLRRLERFTVRSERLQAGSVEPETLPMLSRLDIEARNIENIDTLFANPPPNLDTLVLNGGDGLVVIAWLEALLKSELAPKLRALGVHGLITGARDRAGLVLLGQASNLAHLERLSLRGTPSSTWSQLEAAFPKAKLFDETATGADWMVVRERRRRG